MIAAHGANVKVTSTDLEVTYSPLLTAINRPAESSATDLVIQVPISKVSEISAEAPTATLGGFVRIVAESDELFVRFSPSQAAETKALLDALSAAQHGDTPVDSSKVPGLDFVAFDVETANSDWGSICQLGAVKFVDGIPTKSKTWLVRPPAGIDEFDPDNIAIHGITAQSVEKQPRFQEVLPEFLEFVANSTLIAHNAQFDFTALSRACLAADVTSPLLRFGCTLLLARSSSLGLKNNRLSTLSAHFKFTLDNHHDAEADALACGQIFVALARRTQFEGSAVDFLHEQRFTLGTLEPTRVYPVLRDRNGSGVILQRAQLELPPLAGTTPMLIEEGPKAAANPQPKPGSKSSRAPWSRISAPEVIPEANPEADPDNPLFGQNVTLSGDFEPYDKGELWERIAALGATIGKNVTRKTTIVVCGEWATKTSKQKRAEELIEKGQEIALWTGAELFTTLGLSNSASLPNSESDNSWEDEEPPF